jgi:hypothetical protein
MLSRKKGLRDVRGAVLPLVAVTMLMMLSLLALAIDGGNLQRQRRIAQNAADAGATAGAWEIFRLKSDSQMTASALTETARNGFTNGVGGVVVTVTHPTSPDHFTGSQYVKVVISSTVTTVFARIIGRSSVPVRATAFGGIIAPNGNCLTVLDPSASDALDVFSSAELSTTNCGIAVNSSSSTALDAHTGGVINGDPSIVVTGNYTDPSNNISPHPQVGQAPVPDPLAYLSIPADTVPCNGAYGLVDVTTTQTLSAGVYCGGIKVSSSSAHATFTQGTYYLRGGGLEISASATATSTGTGVTFVNMNAPVGTPGGWHFGTFNFNSSGTITLSAPTSGTWAGILLYDDPDGVITGAANATNVLSSTADITLNGSIYFPKRKFSINSTGNTTINGGVVANTMWVQSIGHVSLTGNAGGTGYYALRRASVVE